MTLVKTKELGFPGLIEELLNPEFLRANSRLAHVPAVNIKETDASFNLELAAPGLKKEDFNLELDNDVLTISAEITTDEALETTEKFTRREFNYQSFKRVFTLPEEVDESKISANYNQGVLNVFLPKKEEALPKEKRLIEIG